MVLEKNVALFGFAELIAILEFALGDGGTELLAAPLELQDFLAANPVLDVVAASYDSHAVPSTSGLGGSFLRSQNVVKVRQVAGAPDFGIGVVDLVFQAKLRLGVREIFYAAIDMPAFEIGIELIIEPEIEAAVLVFRDDAPAELGGVLIPFGGNDLAFSDLPAGTRDLIVGRTLPSVQRFAVKE